MSIMQRAGDTRIIARMFTVWHAGQDTLWRIRRVRRERYLLPDNVVYSYLDWYRARETSRAYYANTHSVVSTSAILGQ